LALPCPAERREKESRTKYVQLRLEFLSDRKLNWSREQQATACYHVATPAETQIDTFRMQPTLLGAAMRVSMPAVSEDVPDTLPMYVPAGEVSGYVTWYDICERQDRQGLCPILGNRLGRDPRKLMWMPPTVSTV